MVLNNYLLFFKSHSILTISLSIIVILFIFIIAFNYKSIITYIKIFYKMLQYCFSLLLIPLKLIWQMLTFQLKRTYYSLCLVLKMQTQNNYLLPNIIYNTLLLIIFFISIKLAVNSSNSDIKSVLYMISGTIISIWVTHISAIILSIFHTIENLNLVYMTIADIRQLVISLYDLLVPFFPYKDDLFKQDKDIIYITPIGTNFDENYLNEQLALNFIGYFEQIDSKILFNSFNSTATLTLIEYMKNQRATCQMVQNTIILAQKYIPNNLNILFQQVMSCMNKILALSIKYQNWYNDNELSSQISEIFRVYIIKLTHCIIFSQREFKLYKKYVEFVSNPPRLVVHKKLSDVINANKSIKAKRNK